MKKREEVEAELRRREQEDQSRKETRKKNAMSDNEILRKQILRHQKFA